MADVKISQLPAATTPLDGTELAPIVQSGTTKRVSVANLTVGRALTASSLTLTTPLSAANGGTGITSLGTGVATFLGTPTSANLAAAVTDETGTGALVFGTSPTITFPAGTVGAPSITTTGDTNTGIYFPAADTIGFVEGGVEAMRLDSAGNVGIGTSSPGAKLDVFGGGGAVTTTIRAATGQNAFLSVIGNGNTFLGTSFDIIQDSSNAASVFQRANAPLIFGTNNTERARIDASGNVGIGTTLPAAKLHVSGSNATNVAFNGSTRGIRFDFDGTQSNIIGVDNTFFGSYQPLFISGSYLALGTGLTERARIDSSGNLLVGTTTSLARLTVSTTGSSEALSITGSNQNGFRFRSASGGAGLVVGRSISSDNANNFFIYDEAGASTMLLISSNGYLNCPGVYNNAAAASNAVNVTPSGDIYRSTSSRKYKNNIQDASFGLGDVLKLRPITYISKNTEISGDRRFGGLIAEEVDEAGLGVFVEYAPDGSPDNIHYGNMVSLAFAAIKELAAKVSALEARQ